MSARDEIAAAANTVTGITCQPYFFQSTKPGDAMVRLDRMTRSQNGFDYVTTWQVLVILPSNIPTAEKYLEANVNDLIEALSAAMQVQSITPQELAISSGTVPVVVIEGVRASD